MQENSAPLSFSQKKKRLLLFGKFFAVPSYAPVLARRRTMRVTPSQVSFLPLTATPKPVIFLMGHNGIGSGKRFNEGHMDDSAFFKRLQRDLVHEHNSVICTIRQLTQVQ